MKLSKYIAALILLSIFTVINIFFNSSLLFTDLHNIRLENRESINVIEMDNIAKKNNVKIFTCVHHRISIKKEEIIIYSDSENYGSVWDGYLGIKPGIIKNPMGSEYQLLDGTLDELNNDMKLKIGAENWYLIGTEPNCKSFILDLKNMLDYELKDTPPQNEIVSFLPYVILSFVFILILLYNYLDSSFLKKEITIRILNGESSLKHYLIFCITDTIVYSLIFLSCIFSQSLYTQLLKNNRYVYLLFIPFIAINWI
ncbi:MAG: hypothetical protein K2K89_04925, partial [Ruminococcus sp.]|nr:hypothetical protein [Ruminococcus sp.]